MPTRGFLFSLNALITISLIVFSFGCSEDSEMVQDDIKSGDTNLQDGYLPLDTSHTDISSADTVEDILIRDVNEDVIVEDTGDIDPCEGITCDQPPQDDCLDANTARHFDAVGTCKDGRCEYGWSTQTCPYGCLQGQCQNCIPDCQGHICGMDPVCGSLSCGTCGANFECLDGSCVCPHTVCGNACCAQGQSCLQGICVDGRLVISSIRIEGKIELVWDWEIYHDVLAPTYPNMNGSCCTFDNPVRFYRDAAGNLFSVAAAGCNYRVPFNSDFSPQRALSSDDIIFNSAVTYPEVSPGWYFHVGNGSLMSGTCVEADYDNVLWIMGLWTEDGIHYAAVAHHEAYPRHCPSQTTQFWVAAVHHMTSSNGVMNLRPMAYRSYSETGISNSHRLVLIPRPSAADMPDYLAMGFFHPSGLVREGDWVYGTAGASFYKDALYDANHGLHDQGMVLFRFRDPLTPPDDEDNLEIYTPYGWQPRSISVFQGYGGQEIATWNLHTDMSPHLNQPAGDYLLSFNLLGHKDTGEWIAFGWASRVGGPLYYMTTPSLAEPQWSPMRAVENNLNLQPGHYPSLVDHQAKGYILNNVGGKTYLYFVAPNNDPIVPAGVGKPVSDPHSRSIWRVPVVIDLEIRR